MAIHPAGLYIAAGFADKIRLLNILIDDMRLFHEFPVRECRSFEYGNAIGLIAVHLIWTKSVNPISTYLLLPGFDILYLIFMKFN